MLVDKFLKNKDGKVVIGQKPNLPIIMALAAWFLSLVFSNGILHNIAYGAFLLCLLWWALLEIIWGVNYFRRSLGLLGLLSLAFLVLTRL